MRAGASLRRRLLAGVLAAVALVWIALSVVAYRTSRRELSALFDAHLAQSASILRAQLSEDVDELDLEHAPELHRYARSVAFQVWEGGRLRLHSVTAPNRPLSDVAEGFSDATVGGVAWRVFGVRAGEDRELLVQVGEREDARRQVSREVAAQLLMPLALALPLLAAVLALTIGRSLKSLRDLADAVGRRDPQRLEPVETMDVPREVLPLLDRLNALFARIAASMESERAFTADAAHELRTPIAAIRAQAEVARASSADAERRHALDQVIAGCDRAARLAEQLLILARLDAGEWQRRLERIDLAAAMREVAGELAQAAHSRGVTLEVRAPDARVEVLGDDALLRVLGRNLVENAVRYGAVPGAVELCVETAPEGPLLIVTDEGPGIPLGERARVLDRFHRVPGTSGSGAGLGLSIVARIAGLHGAQFELREGPGGRGLAAVVRFPAPGTSGRGAQGASSAPSCAP